MGCGKVIPIHGGPTAGAMLMDLAGRLPLDGKVLVIWKEPDAEGYSSAAAGVGLHEALWMLKETECDMMTQTQCCRCDFEGG